MLCSPEAIQKQLSDAVSIIGKYDFPDNWPGLLDEMKEKFATGNVPSFSFPLVSMYCSAAVIFHYLYFFLCR